jgi:hypothetical protein
MREFFAHLNKLRRYGVEYVSNRFYGTAYQGAFDDLKDPQAQGRAKVCSKIVVNRDEALALWAYPVSPYAGKDKGLIMPPDEGDAAWVWFDHGDSTQPRYIGSWWCNDDTSTDPKDPSKSFLPKEFRPEKDKAPTKRGFKSKAGHGWLTEDDPALGLKIRMWSGEQKEAGEEAEKHHELIFDDMDQFVLINSFGKEGSSEDERWQHELRLDDKDEFVRLKSAGTSDSEFLQLRLDDKEEQILLESNKKHFILIDDKNTAIEISTMGGFFTKWDEKAKKIESATAGGNKLTMDDNAMSNELLTAMAQSFKQDAVGTVILEPNAAFNVTATTASTHTYAAALTRTVGGAFTDTIAQALSITVGQATTWIGQAFTWTGTMFTWTGTIFSWTGTQATLTAPQVTIASANVLAGSGANLPLLNTLALAKFNSHFHFVVGPFPGFAQPTPVTMIPAVDTTIALLGA